MLIGNTLEPSKTSYSWEIAANRVADRVRNTWLENRKIGLSVWEETFSEDPLAIPGLREEGFTNLVGLDYIFRWWGAEDSDALAGELDAIWMIAGDDPSKPVECCKTWVKLADRDFILGLYGAETQKREVNREEFRKAFARWKELFDAKNA